ncbi:GAF domain-containing protein [Pseudanabaena galeata UHCC 0370]|uniref:GAF domain-containing protein n=1 Tax=Pseudanabaena galeata UHCC 0370 TaxID=3110310 RepID=A0ABU5TPN0_9CYAN|nr:GAF domain-containing protein [Pseudanabaena galeata]MEA5480105.1 GAF domain-containing protein [Pseudanabaena galeata UHCC 0370]
MSLSKLLKKEILPLLDMYLERYPFAICDIEGNMIYGNDSLISEEKFPVLSGEEIIAWAFGINAENLSIYISKVLNREEENHSLAKEILQLYRETNLLLSISEKISGELNLEELSILSIEEVFRAIGATSGQVVLQLDPNVRRFDTVTIKTKELEQCLSEPFVYYENEGIIGQVCGTGKAEIINNTLTDPRVKYRSTNAQSLLCAPFRTNSKVFGAIVIIHKEPEFYTAPNLKTLSIVAAQISPIIEKALIHAQQLREIKANEEKLVRTVEELRIEIDEFKRQRQVAEITESEMFSNLQKRTERLKQRKMKTQIND